VFNLQVSRFETYVTFALWGIIKLGGPGFAKPEQASSDDFVRHMFSSWIAMMVSGGQNPILWLVDFSEGVSVCLSVCLSLRSFVSSCVASLYAEIQKLVDLSSCHDEHELSSKL